MTGSCIFCKIAAHESAAEIEYEDEDVVAFKDIYPKAPIHLLIIPRRHIESLARLDEADAMLAARCLLVARKLGETHGVAERGDVDGVDRRRDLGDDLPRPHARLPPPRPGRVLLAASGRQRLRCVRLLPGRNRHS